MHSIDTLAVLNAAHSGREAGLAFHAGDYHKASLIMNATLPAVTIAEQQVRRPLHRAFFKEFEKASPYVKLVDVEEVK